MWWMYAIIGALAAGATNVLIKAGMQGVDSYTATAIRTMFILPVVWFVALLAGKVTQIPTWSARNWIFLALSALAGGISWLAAYKAIDMVGAARPGPIDKSSLIITALLAWIWLGEPITPRLGLAYALVVAGAILTIQPAKALPIPATYPTAQSTAPAPSPSPATTTTNPAPPEAARPSPPPKTF